MNNIDSTTWKKHYDDSSSELAALDEREVCVLNLDVAATYSTIMGALPQLRAACGGIGDKLPGFDPAQVEALERYAGAMMHTHHEYLAVSLPVSRSALLEEASKVRQLLRASAKVLVVCGLLGSSVLKEVKGLVGYRNVASDLVTLTQALREAWPTIEHRTALDLAQLDAAASLAKRLLEADGQRGQVPASARAAMEQRQRAFTVLVRAYDEVRAAIIFLRRHHRDADRIAPSLYAGRGARGRKRTKRDDEQPAPELH